MYLELKPTPFEKTYFSWILNKEKGLINKLNNKLVEKISKDDWQRAYNDIREICILISNKIIISNILETITQKNEQKIISEILMDIYNQLKKFINIAEIYGVDDFTKKKLIKNINFKNETPDIISLEDQNSDLYLNKLSSNLEFLKYGVCRDNSFIFLSIFQMLGFNLNKLTFVSVPGHIFIRYIGNNFTLNFETIWEYLKYKTPFNDNKYYISKFNIFQESINDGVFLKNLEIDEIKSVFYNNYGTVLKNYFYEHLLARKMYEKSISLNPKNSLCYNNYANALVDNQEYKRAEIMYKKSISLDPSYIIAYFNYGSLLEKHTNFFINLFSRRKNKIKNQIIDLYEKFLNLTKTSRNYNKQRYLAREYILSNNQPFLKRIWSKN